VIDALSIVTAVTGIQTLLFVLANISRIESVTFTCIASLSTVTFSIAGAICTVTWHIFNLLDGNISTGPEEVWVASGSRPLPSLSYQLYGAFLTLKILRKLNCLGECSGVIFKMPDRESK
jgi:hypothetical protein